ncbi:MAG TPA: dihydroorotate dehydrogenase electron transfer subunit [Bacteroidota bacterium]|nr:dihydroorotate dehydrogenase electron transfer subunit [Bacteroidota bacterium]
MTIEQCAVVDVKRAGEGIYLLSFTSPAISRALRPGQFVNIRVEGGCDPLLRRPFSAYRIEGTLVEVIFQVVGKGTDALRRKREGDLLDVMGPLGVPFRTEEGSFQTAVLLGGGLGVAPLPILTETLRHRGRDVITFLGARTSAHLVTAHLEGLRTATDDGSAGFHGTVVDLAGGVLRGSPPPGPKIFACGPMPMLRAVASLARSAGIPCEVSLEGPMGCGIGICQGCPVERAGDERTYALMCKDGPTFDISTIRL